MKLCTLSFNALAGGALAFALVPLLQTAPQTAPAGASASGHAEAAPAEKVAMRVAKVGEKAPDFTLTDTAGESVTLSKLLADKKFVVLEWFNPDCPVSKGYHTPDSVMGKLAADYRDKNVVWLAINSGAAGKQGAGRERNAKAVEEYDIKYKVLLDENGKVGKEYGAKTTPHMFVIDPAGLLRYAGAIDSGSGQKAGDTNYVRAALDELVAGKDVTQKEARAFGCSVKYAE